jgi:hypothetical protein
VIRKSGNRVSEKITLQQNAKASIVNISDALQSASGLRSRKDFRYHAGPPRGFRGFSLLAVAAMVAPHFSACLIAQSDFGHPAGAVSWQ